MKTKGIFFSILLFTSAHAQIITTIAGNGNMGFSGDGGPATNAEFFTTVGVTVDKAGNIYVADNYNDVIHKIDTNGFMTRFAGTGIVGFMGDGGPATAAQLELYVVVSIASDSIGNIFFTDGSRVRMVNTSGIITTIAGNDTVGYSGDGGPATAAKFFTPSGICFDKKGNLYIADEQNNNIRFVNQFGIISTIAGTTIGFSGDGGPATNAQFKWPDGVALDDSGNLYIADFYNSRLRKINKQGIISSFVGGGVPGVSGNAICEGCPATTLTLQAPGSVAVDYAGNLYVSAAGDHIIQKITQSGLAYLAAGNGTEGYNGDGIPATTAELNKASMICLDNSGNLLIADAGNFRLRKAWLGSEYVPPISTTATQLFVYPNPVTDKYFTFKFTADTNEEVNLVITNILGQKVFRSSLFTNITTRFSINQPPGIYFITATTGSYKSTKKLVVE